MREREREAPPTKVEAGDGVGTFPLSLVRRNGSVLPQQRDPPAKREKPVLDDGGRVETAGEGGGALGRHAIPLHLVWGNGNIKTKITGTMKFEN